jgi:YesN/AraC family two-component response regulator
MANDKIEIPLLYVEDDLGTRALINEVLKRRAQTVYLSENGKEGLEMFEKYKPRIIISDIKMPVMDGLTMIRKIKAIDKDVQTIVTTAYADTGYFLDAIGIGVDQYLLKPIDSDRLITAVDKCAIIIMHEEELRKKNEERERLIAELQDALARIKTLRGLIPICASCKKIRDDKGYWNQLEMYIREHSDAEFTHGICPDCLKKLYPDIKI